MLRKKTDTNKKREQNPMLIRRKTDKNKIKEQQELATQQKEKDLGIDKTAIDARQAYVFRVLVAMTKAS